jgi:hypothetical protein
MLTPIKSAPSGMLEGVTIDYTNYRGERGLRRILPLDIKFGSNEWHPEPQWLLIAIDEDKKAERIFALKDIHSWTPKQA